MNSNQPNLCLEWGPIKAVLSYLSADLSTSIQQQQQENSYKVRSICVAPGGKDLLILFCEVGEARYYSVDELCIVDNSLNN